MDATPPRRRRNNARASRAKGRKKGKKRDISVSSYESEEESWYASSQHSRSPSPDPVQNDKGLRYSLAVYRKTELGSERIIRDRVHKSYEPFDIAVQLDLPSRAKKDETNAHREILRPRYVLEIVQNAYDSGFTCDESRKVNPTLRDLHVTQVLRTQLRLVSEVLLHNLKSMIDYYPQYRVDDFEEAITIAHPYPILMHHFDKINSIAGTKEGADDKMTEERREMVILRDVLQPVFDELVMPVRQLLDNDNPTAYFDMLWYVFRPGDDIYIDNADGIFGAVIRSIDGDLPISHMDKRASWIIEYWTLSSTGYFLGRTRKSTRIDRYSGEKAITALSICPAAIWDRHDGGKRRADIMKRNQINLDALQNGSLHAAYDGPISGHTFGTAIPGKALPTHYSGRVVIDHKNGWRNGALDPFHTLPITSDSDDTYLRFARYDSILVDNASSASAKDRLSPAPSVIPPQPTAREEKEEPRVTSKLTEHQIWLLHPRIPAFALATKTWMFINMAFVSSIKTSDESINNLVIDQNTIRIIRALSTRQDKSNKTWNADFIEGKGAGQIILLHGPPGVGKTHTVESISAWLGRPLLALTVADLGTKETSIEQELIRWFDLAEDWNALLLVDEADVFLEQRKTRDLSRNSLVTAFLRRMEYFRGLLFLTTNRVGQIDDAFMSRVHIAIGYESLNSETRKQIWKGFFAKLARERSGKIIVGKQAKQYVLESPEVQKVELNGREIRNALQTAITLAEFETLEQDDNPEGEPIVVEESHFRRVLQMTDTFKNYIFSIRTEDEAARAYARGDRADYLDQS